MRFSKYHALGNDYLVITPREAGDILQHPEAIQRICHRNYGIGSDGILLGPIDTKDAKFGLRIFNPDGSEAEKSGNGIRIFSRWLWDQGFVTEKPFNLWTKGGMVEAQVLDGGRSVKVGMGRVSFDSREIPVSGPAREVINETMEIAGVKLLYCAATIGNPHCIVLCEKVSKAQAMQLGPLIEREERFPNRINVQFMQVLDKNSIYIEIWERGAGYTLASGSSSCAAAATAYRLGLCSPQITVTMPGGKLEIIIHKNGYINMTGSVTRIAEGEISDEIFSDKIYAGDKQ